MPHQVWLADERGRTIHLNKRCHDYTGFNTDSVGDQEWQRIFHPEDRAEIRRAWQDAFARGMHLLTEARLKGADGIYRWHTIRGAPQRDGKGKVLLWVGTFTDIDEQKQVEQNLKASEESLRVLTEAMPQLVWITLPDGVVIYGNQQYYAYTQSTFEDMRGFGWRQFLHPDDLERVLAIRGRSLETGEPYETEYRIKHGQTGKYRWFLTRALPVRDETDQIVKWFGTNTDIHEHKRIEEELRHSQERVRALMDSNIIGIVVTEGNTIVEANDAYLRLTGYTREEIRNRTLDIAATMLPEQASRERELQKELIDHRQVTAHEVIGVCKDGRRLPMLVGTVALQVDPLQSISFVLDNSARHELEQRKDDFISMASHELRTPLAVLKMQAQRLKKQWETQRMLDVPKALDRIETQVNRLARLIEDLLDVSKINAGKMEYAQEMVDLDALLRETVDVLQQTHETHALVLRGATHATLIGDKERLAQVFINLISNAIKYSPFADTVEIDLCASAEMAAVQVRDHGIGIPQEQRKKIFERFYRAVDSNMKAFPGLGMGLYIAAEIVQRHQGTITVDSEEGKGSTFRVVFPLAKPA